mgnify:CR=1 FL=1
MDLESLRKWVYSHPVITILAVGVIFRIVFFNLVGVNYDAGLYLYDTKLLLEGQVPLIDYFSRSPLFHAFLSPAILFDFSPIVTARIQMVLVSLTLAIVIYLATTKLHSREAGIIAMAVFVLAPFELVWGLWLKTEQVAQLLVLAGLLPLLGHLDDERIPLRDMILLGGAVGAAFFVRRVVIVHFGVVLLFLLYYRYRISEKSLIDPVSRGAVFGISAGVTLLIGYLVWSGGSAGNFVELLNTHLLGLVSEPASAGNAAEGETGILESVFSFVYGVAASNLSSLFTYMRAVTVLLPVLLLLLIFPIVFLRREIGNTRTFSIFAVLGVGAVLLALLVHIAPFTESSWLAEAFIVAIIVGLGLAVIALTPQFEGKSDTLLWNPKLLLPAGLAVAIVVSYAVRDRGMFVTYFQDVFPYLAILTGVAAVVLWQETKLETPKKVAWSGLLAIAIIVSFSMASPLVVGPASGGTQITVTDAVAIGNDLNEEFGDDAQGFSAQPLYMLEANHSVANGFSRKYWIVTSEPESEESREIINETASELESGETQYIIVESRSKNIIIGEISKIFEQNYCSGSTNEDRDDAYHRSNAQLYYYCG